VREDSTPTGPELGEQMSQLMTQRSFNLVGAEVLKYRIKRDE
jgi:hypothetical protein